MHDGAIPHALTRDQIVSLRIARGDRMPPSPYSRPQTMFQDRQLLVMLHLIERKGGSWVITVRGHDYLERIDESVSRRANA